MSTRSFATSRSPFASRRSILSPKAGWPAQELSELPAYQAPAALRYSDEQSIALRFWASASLRKASPREQLETLRHYPGLEPVWGRQVQRALDSNCEQAMRAEAVVLWAKCERLHAHRLRLRQQVPQLYTAITA